MKTFLVILNVLLAVCLLARCEHAPSAPTADYLTSPDARLDRVPVAVSAAAFEEMARASRDRSYPEVSPDGVFFRVPVPVRIRVIAYGVLEEIQIAEGPSAGRTGFVPFEWVQSRAIIPEAH